LHQLAALGFQDAGGYCGLGMEGIGSQEVIAAFIVRRAINNAGNLSPPYGSCTHGARLNGDIKGAIGEILAAKGVGC